MEEQIQEGSSNLAPLGILALLLMAYLVWTLPRRFAFCPVLVMTCLMPLGQELVLFGLHFPLFRLLLLVGGLRVIVRGEAAKLKWTGLDKLFAWWAFVTVAIGTLSNPTMALFVSRSGDAFNALGCYFIARCVIVDFNDIVIGVRTLALVSLPVAALMLVEKATAHNLLFVFGGVPEITAMREGQLRAQGAFRHPILAGTFGATQIPLFVALFICQSKDRLLGIAATISAVIIAITASSSGAFLTVFAAIGGLALWKCRGQMRLIRWGAILTILGFAITMNVPVWYVLTTLGDVFGGGGKFRALLIDTAFSHFNEWWLFGTTYTAHWSSEGPVIGSDPNMMDITNHYVMEGVKGGVLKLGLFLAIIVGSFRALGRVLRAESPRSPAAFLVWAIGVSLFCHCVSFISVTYFDQTIIIWFWLLAIISSLSKVRKPTRNRVSRQARAAAAATI